MWSKLLKYIKRKLKEKWIYFWVDPNTKRGIFWACMIFLAWVGYNGYLYWQREQIKVILNTKEQKKCFYDTVYSFDPNKIIKKIEIIDDSIKNNPVSGYDFKFFINGDKSLSAGISLVYDKETKDCSAGLGISEKLDNKLEKGKKIKMKNGYTGQWEK